MTSIAYGDRAQMCTEAGTRATTSGCSSSSSECRRPCSPAGSSSSTLPVSAGLASVHNAATVAALPGRRRGAVRVGRGAGAEHARARVPQGCVLRVPGGGRGRHQDRLPARVAADRRLDQAHLARAGLPVDVLPVSVVLPPERSGLDAVRDALDRVWAGAVATDAATSRWSSRTIALRQVEQVVRAEA